MATVSKRGNGYRIRVSCGLDIHGTQVIRSMTWTPDRKMTKKQIEKELERQKVLFEEECNGSFVVNSNIKFEALAEEYINHVETNNLLKKTTISNLKNCKERTYTAIGHLRIDKITNRHLQSFIDNLSEPGVNKRNPDKGLAPKSIRHYHNFISDVFKYAIKNQHVSQNPCDLVDLPPLERKEMSCYTLEEAQQFFDLLYSQAPLKYQLFFTLAALGGFRRGELCGLEWKDIDFNNKLITIKRTSVYLPGEGVFESTTKTNGSQRCLKLPDVIFNLASDYKIEQSTQAKKIGDRWIDNDRLFVTWCGKPINPDTPYDFLTKFCKKHNLPKTSVHKLRHFNASILIRNNVDVRTVASALGHAQPTTTLSFYSHAFAEAQAKASEAIADSINIKRA